MTQTTSRWLFGFNIAILILLTIQGWLGGTVSLFTTFPSGTVDSTWSGLVQALNAAGRLPTTHAIIGAALALTAIATLILAFRADSNGVTRFFAILGMLAIFSAAYGGISFVLSGFQDNGSSAQMDSSFIIAYASYFLVLFYNKGRNMKSIQ